MFRVLLAAYLALFACFLPALHTCEPHHSSHGTEAAEPNAHASSDHDDHHHAEGHDDLCVICQLNESSGGVVTSPPGVFAVVPPISTHVDRKLPARPPRFTPDEILPPRSPRLTHLHHGSS